MDKRFKPIFKVSYLLVSDEIGNQNLYCRTSDNVSSISEHCLGDIRDIVGYIKENQQLKEKLEASEKAIVKAVEFIKENKNNLCYLENNIYHSKDDKLLNILDVDKGE